MRVPNSNVHPSQDGKPLFTFRSGGWVILITFLASTALVLWAVAPALMRNATRPPGDGKTVESYRFDLDPCVVDRSLIAPLMLHRNMVPVMSDPKTMPGGDVREMNVKMRGKFLVSNDRVIGVEHNGESRAYPIKLLFVHEIIHDTLGGEPIAITYHWPCDSVRVFKRTIDDQVVEFALSGLAYNSNMLFYIKGETDPNSESHVPESLYNQFEARAISGDDAEANKTLQVIPAQMTDWAKWLRKHPETSVVLEDPMLHKRYKGAKPSEYFLNDKLLAPVASYAQVDQAPGLKDKVIAILGGGVDRIYPIATISSKMDDQGQWTDTVGNTSIRFEAYNDAIKTVMVSIDPSTEGVSVVHGFYFAISAMFPQLSLTPQLP